MKTTVTENCTYEAKLFCGLPLSSDIDIDFISSIRKICQIFCINRDGIEISVTRTSLIKAGTSKQGAIVTFIHYPHFSDMENKIRDLSIELAEYLLELDLHNSITIYLPEQTLIVKKESI